jgi:hypothetical protein
MGKECFNGEYDRRVETLRAFSNVFQFSCKILANQILRNSRLNWITLENAHSERRGQSYGVLQSALADFFPVALTN